MSEGLPPHVTAFLTEQINSVEQVDALLLLLRSPDRSWSAQKVSEELRTSPESAAARLNDLERGGSIVKTADGGFKYQPKNPELDRAIRDLAAVYEQRRYTVINLIFSKPVDHIRTFASAFRLRKDDKDG